MDKIELNSLLINEMKDYFISIGEKAFRGEQVFSYFNRNKKLDIDEMKVLSEPLRNKLKEISHVNKIEIYRKFVSKIDGTTKYLFLLSDNNIIESVAMQYEHGMTICVSTQVGCRMGCSFCASTKEGLIRNLTPAEILNQIYMIEKDLDKTISNIVLMGSGEPLDNYENVMKFLNIIHDEKGHNISFRNITLSTCGVVPKIYDLAKEDIPITLSISLHSPFDEERKKIMPVAKAYSIDELMKACRYYEKETKRRITFEYTLIENVNDREEDLKRLKEILKGLNSHVNLIPLNPIKEYQKDRPTLKNIDRVKNSLARSNVAVTVRREMGADISASCGQLRRAVTESDDKNI